MLVDETVNDNPLEKFSQTYYQQLWSQWADVALAYAAKFGAQTGEYPEWTQEAKVPVQKLIVPIKIHIDYRRVNGWVYELEENEIKMIIEAYEAQKQTKIMNNTLEKTNNAPTTIDPIPDEQKDEEKPTIEELKDYLTVNNIKFSYNAKYETLYAKYLEHKTI